MHDLKPKYFLFIILGLLLSCSRDEPKPEPADSEFITLACLFQENTQFIIKTEEEYLQMAKQIYDDRFGFNCVDTTQAPFDFNTFTLCGKYTRIDMNDKQTNGVFRDDICKKIIYKIEVNIVPGPENNGGYGKIYSSGMNWVKFPKPPDDYEIVIEYTEF